MSPEEVEKLYASDINERYPPWNERDYGKVMDAWHGQNYIFVENHGNQFFVQ